MRDGGIRTPGGPPGVAADATPADPADSASTAAAAATSMPAANTGQGYVPGIPPSMTPPAPSVYERMTSSPPPTPATQCHRRRTRRRPPRSDRAATSPNPTRATLTTTGDQTGPTHGSGIRNRRSVVASDGGQPANTYSQA